MIHIIRKSKELRHTQYVYKSSIAVADIIWGLSISYVFLQQCYLIFSKNIVVNEFENFYLTTIYLNKSDILVYDYTSSKTQSLNKGCSRNNSLCF